MQMLEDHQEVYMPSLPIHLSRLLVVMLANLASFAASRLVGWLKTYPRSFRQVVIAIARVNIWLIMIAALVMVGLREPIIGAIILAAKLPRNELGFIAVVAILATIAAVSLAEWWTLARIVELWLSAPSRLRMSVLASVAVAIVIFVLYYLNTWLGWGWNLPDVVGMVSGLIGLIWLIYDGLWRAKT
jgi:hypothetical protein